MDARDWLAKAKTQAGNEATDEHEREMQMIAKEFLLQTAAADSEVQQEQQHLEEAEKEFAAPLEKTNVALANVQAAAQTNNTNGVSLVPSQTGT